MTNGPVPAKYVPRKEVYLLPQAVCFQRQSYLGSLEFVPRRPVFGTPSSLLRLSFVTVTHFPTSPYRPPPVHYTANTIATPTAATPLHLPLSLPQVPLLLSPLSWHHQGLTLVTVSTQGGGGRGVEGDGGNGHLQRMPARHAILMI